ncbi:hypothetical protein [Plantactinospora sp. GCM10030261]|uniref:hypothetical protein n=1 Tax=Plantactinospora sp. GCM10030261 TaxID=3273420 RepID=UPI0036061F20
MNKRVGAAIAALSLGLATVAVTPPAVAKAPDPGTQPPNYLVLPSLDFYPESITAATSWEAGWDIYAASIVTGAVVRYPTRSSTPEEFVPPGVNIGTAGIMADDARGVLWTCGIDLSFQTPTVLRAFNLETKALTATYTLPDRGVCADIALVGGDVFITDTVDPTVSPALPGRILKLTTPSRYSAVGGTLSVWSADPAFTQPTGGLQINGIAYDGRSSIYTTNYSGGRLVRVDIAADGSAKPAVVIPVSRPLQNPDGIRMLDTNRLLVTENPGPLSIIDVRTGAVTQHAWLDQPTSVVRTGTSLWVAEGQILRLQTGQPPNIPFKLRRVPAPTA